MEENKNNMNEEEKKEEATQDSKDTQSPPGEKGLEGADNSESNSNEQTFKEAIEEIKKGYEEKITKLNEDHKKELDERTEVIKQLLTGGKVVGNEENTETISEKINKKRQYEF